MENGYACMFFGNGNSYDDIEYLDEGKLTILFNDFGMSYVKIKYNGNKNLWLIAEKQDHTVFEVTPGREAKRVTVSDGAYVGIKINGNPVEGEPKRIKLKEDDKIRILPDQMVCVHELY